MPDTLDDWLEEWRRENDWLLDRTEVQRLVDEIERLRDEVTARKVARMPEGNQTRCRRCLPSAGVRVQCEDCRRIDKRAAEIRAADEIERLRGGWAPTIDEQVRIVRSWGWQRVANYHDARPGRDGPDVKACSHLDTDWCSQRDKGRMIPVFRPPIGATGA